MTGSIGKNIKIEQIGVLRKENCKIKNIEYVERLISELVEGGANKLQVVSDFDFTITKQILDDGTTVLTSFGIFNECKSLPEHYLTESRKLYHKYRPLEIDPTISLADKERYMVEWWTESGKILTGFPFDPSEIDENASKYKEALRDGTKELFKDLNDLNVPVLVFSAGLGDSVKSVMKHANVLYPNVKVISNFLQYTNGYLNGFQDNMIHSFNKNETAIEGTEYYDLVHDRGNVIVMGDSLGDAGMAAGMPVSSNVLKIGFLYDHAEQNLEKYMSFFDIVLVNDQTMDVPNALLSLIRNNGQI